MSMDNLYTELIMMHNRSGHNKHALPEATHIERGHNPNCGDDLTLQLWIEEGIVKDAAYVGHGCAISQAAMSIMIDLVKEKPVAEAKVLAHDYLRMIRGEQLTEDQRDALADAIVFESLSKMPARVKCGTLGWHCLEVSLADKLE